MSSIIYFQLLPNDVLKDSHVRSASSPSARRQFRNRGRRVRPARVYRSWIPVEESVYPNFHVAERKYSVYVTAFARGPVRCLLARAAPPQTMADVSPPRVPTQPFPFAESRCRGRKQFARLGQQASSAEVLHVEGLGKPRAWDSARSPLYKGPI